MRNTIRAFCGARLHLSLSRTAIRLGYTAHPWRRGSRSLLDLSIDGTGELDRRALIASLAPVLGDRRYAGLTLSATISDEWARFFLVSPPKNTVRMQDARSAAAVRFNTLYGDNPTSWRIICDDAIDRAFLACAMPAAVVSSVESLANTYGLHLISLTPTFISVWNRAHRRLGRAWIGVVADNSLTVGCIEGASPPALAAVHRLRLPADYGNEHWLAEQTRWIALRYGLGNPREMKLFGRHVPALNASSGPHGLSASWADRCESRRIKFGLEVLPSTIDGGLA